MRSANMRLWQCKTVLGNSPPKEHVYWLTETHVIATFRDPVPQLSADSAYDEIPQNYILLPSLQPLL